MLRPIVQILLDGMRIKTTNVEFRTKLVELHDIWSVRVKLEFVRREHKKRFEHRWRNKSSQSLLGHVSTWFNTYKSVVPNHTQNFEHLLYVLIVCARHNQKHKGKRRNKQIGHEQVELERGTRKAQTSTSSIAFDSNWLIKIKLKFMF